MKLLKKVSVLFTLCLMMAGVWMPMQAEAATINKTSATVYVGDKVTLKLTGTSKKKTWKSSNTSVATVTSTGVVKAKKAGTATITVKYGTYSKKCKVTVKSAPTLSASKTTIYVNKTKTLKVNRPIGTVTWSSSNKAVATVSKGKITAKKTGTATITAKVKGRTLKCKVTVKNAPAKATSISFKTADGGDFITKLSTAKVTFKLDNASTGVKVQILDTAGDVVRSKTFTSCKKNTAYTYEWNGKNSDGDYVEKGSYRVRIIAGSKKTTGTKYLKVLTKNPFAAGTGAKSNPYQVKTLAHLKKIALYPTRHFVQKANIDGEYETITPLCTSDIPFSGTYNGKGYKISNLIFNSEATSVGLFMASSGTISNVKMSKIYSSALEDSNTKTYAGTVVAVNTGTVKNCAVSDSTVSGALANTVGGIVGINKGTITACEVSNVTVAGSGYSNSDPGMGGIAGCNEGKIIDCSAENVTVSGWVAGGITGYLASSGQCISCETTGECTISSGHYAGATVGFNGGGAIVDCTTTTSYKISGYN